MLRRYGPLSVSIAAVCAAVACGDLLEAGDAPLPGQDGETDAALEDAGMVDGEVTTDAVTSLAVGNNFGCVLHASRKVACWGSNTRGQLGTEPPGDLQCDDAAPCRVPPVAVAGLTDVTKLAAGSSAACAVQSDGKVLCWGSNRRALLGHASEVPLERAAPQAVPDLPPAVDVAVGLTAACAIVNEDGGTTVYCWGASDTGMTGLPTGTPGFRKATRIPALDGAKKISLATNANLGCAVTATDNIACWGANFRAVTGHTPATSGDTFCEDNVVCTPTPTQVGTNATQVVEVEAGQSAACARTTSGAVVCWGANDFGLLGQGSFDTLPHDAPVEIGALAGATALSLRATHACAVVAGSLYCWGSNIWGEIGTALGGEPCAQDQRCEWSPRKLSPLPDVKLVETGAVFTIAVGADGSGWGWGANIDARIGHLPGASQDLATCGPTSLRCNPSPQRFAF